MYDFYSILLLLLSEMPVSVIMLACGMVVYLQAWECVVYSYLNVIIY